MNRFYLIILFTATISKVIGQTSIKKDTLNLHIAESVTNNGISFIPSFTLGKPASVTNLGIGGRRMSFEAELRYSLEGKPWGFVGFWRYKLINDKKFQLTPGIHLPAIAFREITVQNNGVDKDMISASRFLPFEINANYNFSKNFSMGLLSFYAYGLDVEAPQKNTNFISLRAVVSNIKLVDDYSFKFNPQVFYLRSDYLKGYYVAASLSLSKKNFPVSLSYMMTKVIDSQIATKDFNWNFSLNYSFDKKVSY